MRVLLASLALAAIAGSTHAGAQMAEANSATIFYGDLNLSSPAGYAAFEGRVRVAANQICADFGIVPLERSVTSARCKAKVAQSANSQLSQTTASSGGGFPPATR